MSLEFPYPAALLPLLQLSIPLWVERLEGLPAQKLTPLAVEAGLLLSERGDVVQFGWREPSQKGERRDAFNVLARGIAAATLLGGNLDAILTLLSNSNA